MRFVIKFAAIWMLVWLVGTAVLFGIAWPFHWFSWQVAMTGFVLSDLLWTYKAVQYIRPGFKQWMAVWQLREDIKGRVDRRS